MSRVSVSNENYELAFGVDATVGTFFVIYGPKTKAGDRFVQASYSAHRGLQVRGPEYDGTCTEFEHWQHELKPVLAKFNGLTGNLAEEHVTGLAKAMGLYSKELELKCSNSGISVPSVARG